jgi:anaerobic selenocysteine-containing dehydrogenase
MLQHNLTDGDWAKVSSVHGSITVPVAHMAALNENTVWTWNAIGKRKGAWALGEESSEATKGFLLNHLIHELLPPKGDGLRWANSDPITGQAAWFDLRVKIAKAETANESQPAFDAIKSPVGAGPAELTWKVSQ